MADSPLKLRLTEAMKSAMKAQQKDRLSAIRMILADIKRIEVDERIEPGFVRPFTRHQNAVGSRS